MQKEKLIRRKLVAQLQSSEATPSIATHATWSSSSHRETAHPNADSPRLSSRMRSAESSREQSEWQFLRWAPTEVTPTANPVQQGKKSKDGISATYPTPWIASTQKCWCNELVYVELPKGPSEDNASWRKVVAKKATTQVADGPNCGNRNPLPVHKLPEKKSRKPSVWAREATEMC